MIACQDSLSFIKTLPDFDIDIIYADPPYALGSEVVIRKDGRVDYAKANDFMNKWTMPTGDYWADWFIEAYRTLKHGGYLIMFGMDRQLLLFKYYACLSGFVEQQSLYWYFISNFPKATDLSKMIDKNNGRTLEQYTELGKYIKESRGDKPQKSISKFFPSKTGNLTGCVANWELGLNVPTKEQWKILKTQLDLDNRFDELIEREEAKREVVGKGSAGFLEKNNSFEINNDGYGNYDITKPNSDLAKKYEGYKYSISPLKQTNETIMVFQKPCKTGSPLHDTLAYENGDNTITVSALNIDGNRVGTEDSLGRNNKLDVSDTNTVGDWGMKALDQSERTDGRYPAQTFIDSKVAERLDLQSENYSIEEDVSCSKILHKCDYTDEDYDLYNYEPKVSASERSAGCDDREAINVNDGRNTPIDNPYQRGETLRVNTHPTLKPIALNEKILKLFKTPNNQKICYPFAGAGSEIIGGIKAGFDNWCGCEISQEYVDIANARIKYWKEEMTTQTSIFDFLGDTK